MPGFIINGKEETAEGLEVKNWLDDARLRVKMPEDGGRRTTPWVRSIVLHTTLGIPGGSDRRPQLVLPGMGPSSNVALNVAHFWSANGAPGGAHIIVDFDGSVTCLADLQTESAYHATTMNAVSIGIEIAQRKSDAAVYEGQLQKVVELVDWLTRRFRIQRQIPSSYKFGAPAKRLVAGGKDYVGVCGHRDQTTNRGPGDPGDRIFELLREGGYDTFDLARNEDKVVWKARQLGAGVAAKDADGIPGPNTCLRLEAAGHAHGLWVTRPGD